MPELTAMDGADQEARRPSLKERLGFNLKGLGCCGATWGLGPTTVADAGEGVGGPLGPIAESISAAQSQAQEGMNLAAALAAERQLRALLDSDIGGGGTPGRVSLMRLLEDTDGCDGEMEIREEGGFGWVCCVCMGRKKGAAFIPCGHTFCRVCSREMWLNRGACPLCNRPILEILDIY